MSRLNVMNAMPAATENGTAGVTGQLEPRRAEPERQTTMSSQYRNGTRPDLPSVPPRGDVSTT
jgi:hypothetical protein